jgi:polyferredoxin
MDKKGVGRCGYRADHLFFYILFCQCYRYLGSPFESAVYPGVLGITTGGALTVTVIFLLTLLFGRVYCSLLCPLGIYQDIINRIAWFIKSGQKRRTHYSKPNDGIRYGILAFVTVCVVFGFTYPLVWLDPYSLFGKMAVNLGRPLVAGITGAEYYTWRWPAFAFAAAFFAFITLLAAFRGRYYCNTICPVGTLLGLVSKISMFRIQVNESECRHCLLCGKSCKSYCLDSSGIKVDHSRCVVCLNCIGSCNTKAVTYAFAWKKKVAIARKKEEPTAENKSRRAFLISALGVGVSAGAGVALLNRFKGKARVKVGAGLPPGAGNLERLQINVLHVMPALQPVLPILLSRHTESLDGRASCCHPCHTKTVFAVLNVKNVRKFVLPVLCSV